MTRLLIASIATAALSLSISDAYVPSIRPRMPMRTSLASSFAAEQKQTRTPVVPVPQSDIETPLKSNKTVLHPTESESASQIETQEPNVSSKVKKAPKKPVAVKLTAHKEGIFSPVVYVAKDILGEERLNKLRGDIIALHSDAIKGFVGTADSQVGQTVLRNLFELSDRNKDGKIDKEELRSALRGLGFEWLNEKQISGIFDRADLDKNGEIDLKEWMKEAPKTLKTNLIKLAKNNGGKMGLLV